MLGYFLNPAHVVRATVEAGDKDFCVIVLFDNGSSEYYACFDSADEANDFAAKACGGNPAYAAES